LERLRRKTEINRVFEEGRRLYSPWVALQAYQRPPGVDSEAGPRLAVVAGKRFRGSVERNRARRLLRETCRIALGESRGPWDLILIARVEVLDIPFAERLRVLASLLRQAGVLSEEVEAA
jgi:ribonuclease P protein component